MPSESVSNAEQMRSLPAEIIARIAANRQVSTSGFVLTLAADISPPVPGQFVMLGLPRSASSFLRRPFSIHGFNAGRRLVKIYYSVSGRGTKVLSEARRGEELSLLGPLGQPFPESSRELQLMVGGGRGGAPLVFLSRARHRSKRVFFLIGARCAEEIIPLGEVRASRIFVSTEDGSLGKRGTVLELMESVEPSPGFDWSRAVLYACGPAGMLRELHQFAAGKEIPCFVSLEARMACGLGVCQGCAVGASGGGYWLVCKDGPVLNSSSVDWNRFTEAKTRAAIEDDVST
jgi:dihydroorotate dehydrogenase electron transfer subunit